MALDQHPPARWARRHLASPLVMVALVALAAGCAKQARPPGGEVDRTAPKVRTHQPAADATGVPLTAPIVIEFNEAMEHGRTEEAVFLSPADPFDTDWDGRRLRLRVRGGLAEGRTYVVTVGTDARDLRSNRLEDAFIFAFATGERLDSGTLTGRILSADDAPQRGAYVWAYDLDRPGGRIVADPPAYVTQTGTDGTYRFERLAAARYRVLGFVDEDRDQRPDPAELLSLPAADADVTADTVASAGDQRLAQRGGTRPRLTRTSAIDAGRLLLVFDRPVQARRLDLEIQGLAVLAVHADPTAADRLHVLTAPQADGQRYRLRPRYDGEPLEGPEEDPRGTSRPDRTPPKLVSTVPSGPVPPAPGLHLRFAEAMDTTRVPDVGAWRLAEGAAPPGAEGAPAPADEAMPGLVDSTASTVSTDTTEAAIPSAPAAVVPPAGRWQWTSWTDLTFTPSTPLAAGPHSLGLRLRGPGGVTDRAGNAPGDSLARWSFEVLEPAMLSTLRGQVTWPEGPARVFLRDANGVTRQVVADSTASFRFEGLAPGTYTVVAWVDRDGDGAWGAGRVEPYEAAEPYAVHGPTKVERGVTVSVVLPGVATP